MIKYNILSANMCRMNAAMHALLHTNTDDDVLAVQEPWFGRVGVVRDDGSREGKESTGGAAHREWNIHYPYHTTTKRAKVITYTHKFSWTHTNSLSPIRTIPRLDLIQHPSILITDHYVGSHALRIINFYHDTEDSSSLQSLLNLDLDSTFPTILIGDFNLHSHSWSPPDIPTFMRAWDFEAWAAAQTFDLITSPGDVTRRGFNGKRSSTLDLTWHNLATSMTTPLTPPTINWAAT